MSRYMKDGELYMVAVLRDGVLLVAALIGLMVSWPLFSVPTGSRGVITVGGAIRHIEGEGYTLLWPWQKLSLFSIRSETADVENAEGSTNDTQPVHVSMTVRYSIAVDKVAEVFEKYSHDGNLQSYVQTATQEIFKAVTAKYNAPDLIAQRGKVSSDIYSALQAKLDKYGAVVINIDMRNFAFSPSYMAAINEKVTQEQLRLGAENKLKTVESEQKQKVAVAQAEAGAVKATADGAAYKTTVEAKAQAEANLAVAVAQAKALQIQNDALAKNKDVLELRRIEVQMRQAEHWDGKLPTAIYAGAPIPFLQVGASH